MSNLVEAPDTWGSCLVTKKGVVGEDVGLAVRADVGWEKENTGTAHSQSVVVIVHGCCSDVASEVDVQTVKSSRLHRGSPWEVAEELVVDIENLP